MKDKIKELLMDSSGVEEASRTVQTWLEEAGTKSRDVARFRVTVEELAANLCRHGDGQLRTELAFLRRFGRSRLRIRYGGERYDPTIQRGGELEEFTALILARTGISPSWRWRDGKNELLIHVSDPKRRPELLMLGCVALAAVTGLLGPMIPEGIRSAVSDYVLSFLADGFLRLLGTFIGLMIFLTVITGICGIGSAAALGRIGKQMMTRFLVITFLLCGLLTGAVRFFFPLGPGTGGGGSGLRSVADMLFNILPSDPVRPFLEGNTLQIVLLASIVGVLLLLTGSRTEALRSLISQAQILVMRCVTAVCSLLPIYIFSSLVRQLWTGGAGLLTRFGKPLALCAGLSAAALAGYLTVTCLILKVRPSVLSRKLLPVFLIGVSTSSFSAAFVTGMEINEKKLGIDPAFSRMAYPIGGILFAASFSLIYVITGAFMAECAGLQADAAWWIMLWIVSSLLAMSTPPVAGGMISGLSVLMAQLRIPPESLAVGVALSLFLDFMCTGTRIPILHMELSMQADRLGLLDRDVLRRP